ncbi:hypothetical protein [Lentzea jiangxiensis]|uniref:Uncharacterized protein n=1 Tax=Lentzea jiangxiensis TaxID=641025 RepID=A0A1H0H0F7_9PSEU|nr:hypothetical protein [Lentzea jiangxiensis]SDO12615.1 hypothetical protein SAMN05421507_1011449 [Lentzea jiangxiensis]
MRTVLLFLVVLLAGCGGTAQLATHPPAPQTSTSDELAPADFQARWWTWASQPANSNPVSDTSGRFCMRDQPVEVWLLAGSLTEGPVERQCRVPADKPLLAPAVNLAGDIAGCEAFMKTAQGEVLLNNATQRLTAVPATPFTYEARAGNPFGTRAGRLDSVGCGLYAWIPAPPSGEHDLVIRGSAGGRNVDVKYKLIVGAD